MAVTEFFIERVCEQLPSELSISIKKLFGEALVCSGDYLVGLITDDVLYLKADTLCRKKFEEYGMRQMENSRPSCDGLIYYEVSEPMYSEPEMLIQAIKLATDVVQRNKQSAAQQELVL